MGSRVRCALFDKGLRSLGTAEEASRGQAKGVNFRAHIQGRSQDKGTGHQETVPGDGPRRSEIPSRARKEAANRLKKEGAKAQGCCQAPIHR